ncbi:hypothetical protein SAY86_028246 [Trapa natans]|uniref:Fcf2 pre-rRNA processing C-terminal domain-containing protein n=1 Tax=Trapa natans TaxID=22666 RepID=A0AAN7RC13_TRANT|nr:hypothetical protein SAY86_028246 [Trapa natans]
MRGNAMIIGVTWEPKIPILMQPYSASTAAPSTSGCKNVGTVIESAAEFYNRLKKERKTTIADELLSDFTGKNYWKRKVREIEEQNRPAGNDKWKIKDKMSKRAKQRRH